MIHEENERFIAFAADQGVSTHEANLLDYILWIKARWREWAEEVGHDRAHNINAPLTTKDHAAFDAWLAEKVGR